MTDIRVSSWNQLQDAVFDKAWNTSLQRYRSPCVFRGLPNAAFQLETSLMRLGGAYWELERHLLRNFRKYASTEEAAPGSFWHLLSVAQHHGLPTRLLDWTYSPLVALHFATCSIDDYHRDGAIWMVNFEDSHDLLPKELRELLHAEGAQAFTVELLTSMRSNSHPHSASDSFHRVVESLAQFDALGAEQEFLLFFEPPSIKQRIVNQFALFSVMPNPVRSVDSWLAEHDSLYQRIIIPAELKWECRDKLDQCNITERVLFPGLDGLSAWLRRHYSPKTSPE